MVSPTPPEVESATSVREPRSEDAELAGDARSLVAESHVILVAESDETKRKVIASILASAGHRVTAVASGESALDALESCEYDFVLIALNLTGMNGIDTCKIYRFLSLGGPRVPIVGISSPATEELRRLCTEAGLDGCIDEPFEANDLLHLVGSFLSKGGKAVQSPTNIAKFKEPNFAQLADRGCRGGPVDLTTLDSLECLGGAEFANTLAVQFCSDASSILRDLPELLASDEIAAIHKGLHNVRSAASNIGANRIGDVCLALEKAVTENQVGLREKLVEDLRKEYEFAYNALQRTTTRDIAREFMEEE